MPFLLILILLPIIEISLFVIVGDEIGLLATLGLIFLSAMFGGWLIQTQGLHTMARVRMALDRRVLPVYEMFEGMCLFVAGLLLVLPGFFTDCIGLILCLPFMHRLLFQRAETRFEQDGGDFYTEAQYKEGRIIEGDFKEVKDGKDKDK